MSTGELGSHSQTQPVPGKVAVRITADGMEATLTVAPPRNGGPAVTLAQALQELAKAGISYGIETNAVEGAVKESERFLPHEPGKRPVSVARGKAPERGRDAVVTYDELLQTPSGYPLLKADGKVDYFQLHLVRNVAPGHLLATRQPATKGIAGTNVYGVTVPALDGKEIPLKAGKGCRLSEDGLSVVADIAGHAVLSPDGKITVSPIFEVRGDVDTSTGNIDFVGTVVVRGNVNHGFTVRAEQGVEIHGGVDGGTVECGGDVTIAYGVQGAGRGRVVCGGQVKCRFMENADVRAYRDVIVSDGILHSRVRSGGKVMVTGRRGSIIGGQVKAKEEVSARILGSNLATATEVEVGIAPETRDELETVRRSLVEAEDGLRKSLQAVQLLRDLEAKHPAEFSAQKREMLMRSVRSQYHFQAQRDQLSARKAQLEDELQISFQGRVRAFDMAYPGVKVMIGNESYVVIDVLQHVCFYLSEQHEVMIGPA